MVDVERPGSSIDSRISAEMPFESEEHHHLLHQQEAGGLVLSDDERTEPLMNRVRSAS
jgi:hypothetical protein